MAMLNPFSLSPERVTTFMFVGISGALAINEYHYTVAILYGKDDGAGKAYGFSIAEAAPMTNGLHFTTSVRWLLGETTKRT